MCNYILRCGSGQFSDEGMKPTSVVHVAGLVVSMLVSGCALSGDTTQRNLRVSDVVVDLQMQGMTLVRSGVATLRSFTTRGVRYAVGQSGSLHLYEYADEDQAAFDASRAHGGIDASIYHRGTIVAVYFGRDMNSEMMISQVMGPRVY